MINWGLVPLNSVIPFPFATYGKTNGESITLTGLATTDIEVYKGTSVTQRSSDNGYALIDTDGIDIDSITGLHGFSIDTSDDSDAGFYAAGSFYYVVISAVTVDGQTVNFIAGTFFLVPATSSAGAFKVDVTLIAGSAVSTTTAQLGVNVVQLSTDATAADNAEAFFDGTGYAGTGNTIPTVTSTSAIGTGGITTGSFAAGAIDAAAIAANAIGASEIADGAIDAGAIAADAITAAKIADGAIDAATFAAGAITATVIATDAIDADALAADAVTEIWAKTMAELSQAAPSATPSMLNAIALLYMVARNQVTVTSSEKTFSNDAGTVVFKKALSDNGTTLSLIHI